MSDGIEGSQIETVSYGKEKLIDLGHSETAWAMNRNDQFAILIPTVTFAVTVGRESPGRSRPGDSILREDRP